MISLPARLDDARHLAEVTQLTKRNTRHPELAIESARTTGDFATVADTRLRSIARQRSELQSCLEPLIDGQFLVHDGRLQGSTLGGLVCDGLAAALVLFNCAGFRHIGVPS